MIVSPVGTAAKRKETLDKWLRGHIAALRGARSLTDRIWRYVSVAARRAPLPPAARGFL